MANRKRYLCRQLIHSNAVHLAVVEHELYRVAHIEKDGLTEKELAFLKRTLAQLKETSERLTKLGNKIQGTL